MQSLLAFVANLLTVVAQCVTAFFFAVAICFSIVWLAPGSAAAEAVQPFLNLVSKLAWAKGVGFGRVAPALWSTLATAIGAIFAAAGDFLSRVLSRLGVGGWFDWFLRVFGAPAVSAYLAVATAWQFIQATSGGDPTVQLSMALVLGLLVCLLVRRGWMRLA